MVRVLLQKEVARAPYFSIKTVSRSNLGPEIERDAGGSCLYLDTMGSNWRAVLTASEGPMSKCRT